MNDKIDMVYLWCDGKDPEFRERKREYLALEDIEKDNEESTGNERFFDNEELKYSLRSLEKYAPWINHVYIVTDRQVPKWLDTSYKKVTVVDHSEIMPKYRIPCFNSAVIEYYLPFIPNLSEKFLYGNDDMFFGRPVQPEDFFQGDKPIVRVKNIKKAKLERYSNTKYRYYDTVLNSLVLLNNKYAKNLYFESHHNIDAYKKSLYMLTLERYKNEFAECIGNRFRHANDIQRIIFNLDMVYSGEAILKIVDDPRSWRRMIDFVFRVEWESFCSADNSSKLFKHILEYKPKFFCINSGENSSIAIKQKVKQFMEDLFPKKSRFEK